MNGNWAYKFWWAILCLGLWVGLLVVVLSHVFASPVTWSWWVRWIICICAVCYVSDGIRGVLRHLIKTLKETKRQGGAMAGRKELWEEHELAYEQRAREQADAVGDLLLVEQEKRRAEECPREVLPVERVALLHWPETLTIRVEGLMGWLTEAEARYRARCKELDEQYEKRCRELE